MPHTQEPCLPHGLMLCSDLYRITWRCQSKRLNPIIKLQDTSETMLCICDCSTARQPSTSLPSDDVILLVGQRLRLQCRVAGRPQPVVTWYKNQEVAADRRIKVTKNRLLSQL
jgi:hypothetical protein